jgi:hypothetical protein
MFFFGESWKEWRVEGMDSFHPLMPMNRAIERSGGGMDEVLVTGG